jgi:quaternary ammonium compound-resistance protein SugE
MLYIKESVFNPIVEKKMNTTVIAWVCLIVAGLLEVVWATAMKYSEGFTRLTPSIVAILSVMASLYLLSVAIRTIPLGIAYAIWVGIGASMVAVYGMLFFQEPVSVPHLASIGLIIVGVVSLNMLSN